jgi:hypothetical protein
MRFICLPLVAVRHFKEMAPKRKAAAKVEEKVR